MLDDPLHDYGMMGLANACRGRVLVAGLGLGLVIHYLLKNKHVEEITVIEKNPSIIQYLLKYISRDNINIMLDDVYTYAFTYLKNFRSDPTRYDGYDCGIIDLLYGVVRLH